MDLIMQQKLTVDLRPTAEADKEGVRNPAGGDGS